MNYKCENCGFERGETTSWDDLYRAIARLENESDKAISSLVLNDKGRWIATFKGVDNEQREGIK